MGISVFLPILSHILIPAQGKDKKRTAARRPQDDRTLVCDLIVRLKWHHHVASQWIQDFLEAFFIFQI